MEETQQAVTESQGEKPKFDKKLIGIIVLCVFVIGAGIAVVIAIIRGAQTVSTGVDGIEITSGGTYTISDDISSGSVIVRADEADVHLVLDGVSIKNTSGPAIFIESAGDVTIELKGENKITATATKDYNGAIYSKSDLILSGDGSLEISSTIDGIVSKDDLKIDGGTFIVNAKDEGIVGKDSITINGGDLTITATNGHGLKTSNEEKKGDMEIAGGKISINSGTDGLHSIANIRISDGVITISAGDDGIHADSTITIDGGTINVVKSYEGIEGGEIVVNSGDIKVVASDDGLNAAGGSDNTKSKASSFSGDTSKAITIAGGNVYVDASGDGIDSNGNIYISGGTTYVDGPTNNGNGAMDYGDGGCEFVITGGTLVAVGSSGMAVNATSAEQVSVLMNLSGSYSGALSFGTINYTPSKTYDSVLISSPELNIGDSYTLTIGEKEIQTATITNSITNTGTAGMMPGMGQGRQGGMR